MPDINLSTSIDAIKTRILNSASTATVEEISSYARAARAAGLDQDSAVETAINDRVVTLSATSTSEEVRKLAATINQIRNAPVTSSILNNTDQLSEGTENLYYTDARVDARLPSDISELTDTTGLLGSGSGTTPFTKFYLSASQPGSTVSSSSYLGQNVGTWYEVTFANAANTAGLSPDSSDRNPTLSGITFSGDKFSGFVQNGTYEISVQPEVYERNSTAGQRYHGWEASTGAFSSAGWLSPGTGSFNINGVTVPDSIIVTFEDATPANNWVRYILESDQSGDYWIGQAILTIKKIG